WRTRLAALGADDLEGALRLSRAEARFLDDVRALRAEPHPPAVGAYLRGPEAALAAALLRSAAGGPPPGPELERAVRRGAAAELPLRAADLIEAGLAEGPALGRALKAAEAAWLASEFSLDRDALLREALAKGHSR
ncbi:MAG TPA: CCA tRNA nucleotidyltransferase, partial [Thermohalobaculum sp.]|nr:CCA tRNA nucleotidyltransferase [Thermohalobaculum sp.]